MLSNTLFGKVKVENYIKKRNFEKRGFFPPNPAKIVNDIFLPITVFKH